jgi:uncharacterized membrane protein
MVVVIIIILQLIFFAVFAMTPFVTRRGECFGVSTPPERYATREIAALRRRYVLLCAGACVLTGIPPRVFFALGMPESAALICHSVCVVLNLLAIFLSYVHAHKAVKRMKREQGWASEKPQIIAAPATPARALPSMLVLLLPMLVLLLGSIGIGYAFYPALPDRVATHWNAAMQPDVFSDKSPGLIWMMPAIQVFIALCFAFVHVSLVKSKRKLEANDPEGSLRRDEVFRSAWAWFLIVIGVLMSAGMTLLQAATFQLLSVGVAFGVIMGATALSLVGGVVLSIKVGQGGSRLKTKPAPQAAVDYDDDRFWKLGSFYYNPDDPSVFVEKRFGVGFTNNFARPLTWVLMGALVLLIVGASLVGLLAAG